MRILIIANSADEPYQQATAGFKAQLASQAKPEFTELTLAEAKAPGARKIADIKPELIYALGSDVTQWLSQQTTAIPIVATLVVKENALKQAPNMTGVSLDYSLRTQFELLKKFFPSQKNVAVLFNPAENGAYVASAKTTSQQAGFNLVPLLVESPKELPYALEHLASNIDVLLAIPDEIAMSDQTAKEVLLASFSNKVPLVGLSDSWVKAGALYALSWDYEDLGKQCATMAQKILAGSAVQTIAPEHPRKVTYTINAKIAEHMDVEISANLRKNAKMVFD